MNGGREPDDEIAIECDGDVMPIVGEKLARPPRVDRVIEYVGRDHVENVSVSGAQQPDLYRHW
jgi:hypothetical protein